MFYRKRRIGGTKFTALADLLLPICKTLEIARQTTHMSHYSRLLPTECSWLSNYLFKCPGHYLLFGPCQGLPSFVTKAIFQTSQTSAFLLFDPCNACLLLWHGEGKFSGILNICTIDQEHTRKLWETLHQTFTGYHC